jgi:hypothetical protein
MKDDNRHLERDFAGAVTRSFGRRTNRPSDDGSGAPVTNYRSRHGAMNPAGRLRGNMPAKYQRTVAFANQF